MHAQRWMGMWAAVLTVMLSLAGAALGAQPRKPIDWAALNPAFAGATFVNDPEVCSTCHEVEAFDHTKHAQAFGVAPPPGGRCESCHGPGSKHVENPTGEIKLENLTAAQQSMICLQCHEGESRFGWKFGAHQANDVSCLSCHYVMEKKSNRRLLAKGSFSSEVASIGAAFRPPLQEQDAVSDTCYQCHSEVRGEMAGMSHHPVREGRLECASCHNPHGGTPGLLVKNTLNETCLSCHSEKRGPFVWEHAPVRESCANCHTPHGSNHRNLLTNKDSFLCLSCHSYGGHVNLPRFNRVSNPYGSGCVNCHINVHGSNHPSGAKLTR